MNKKDLLTESLVNALHSEGKMTESVNWDYYNKFDEITDKYMSSQGEGETLASQIVTAINKLVYKWYNDGDVFDNVHSSLSGWANDLSSYANWLYKYCEESKPILYDIYGMGDESDYETLLQELADACLNEEFLKEFEKPKQGSIYNCDGPFEFSEYNEDEEEEDYYDDDEYLDNMDESKRLNEERNDTFNYRVQVLTTSDNIRYLNELGKLTTSKGTAKVFTSREDAENVVKSISRKPWVDVAAVEKFTVKPKLSKQQIVDKMIKDNNIDNELAEDIEYNNWSQQDFIAYIKKNYDTGVTSIEDDIDDYNANSKKELYDMWKLVYQKLKNQSKEVKTEAYTARDYFEANMKRYLDDGDDRKEDDIKVLAENEDFILTGARDEEYPSRIYLQVTSGSYDSVEVFIDQNYKGKVDKAEINWSALGNVDVSETEEFIKHLQLAIEFCKEIDGKDYSNEIK